MILKVLKNYKKWSKKWKLISNQLKIKNNKVLIMTKIHKTQQMQIIQIIKVIKAFNSLMMEIVVLIVDNM